MRGRWGAAGVVLLLVVATGTAVGAARASDDQTLERVAKIVVQIQRADYQGDRAALKRLYADLAPYMGGEETASRVRYWRGFALWRRAINGFNDSVDPKELQQDLEGGIAEFNEALKRDPGFADAKIGIVSSLGYLMYNHRAEQDQLQGYMAKVQPVLQELKDSATDNPRFYWVMGPLYWRQPAERGGGQAKAFEAMQKGLELARKQKGAATDPLEPSWGEPELLMAEAWYYQNAAEPDLNAAEKDARAALTLVPDWHYVRDILLPQIEEAKTKKKSADKEEGEMRGTESRRKG
jgi:hypothetical protein